MRRLLVSLCVAAAVLAAFLFVLDPARLASQLAGTDLAVFALGLFSVVAAFGCWGEASRRLFVVFDASLSRRRAFAAYGAGAFGKLVLPMGNAGGPAVMAYAFNREVTLGYSRSLAVVVVAEFLSLAASLLLGLVGLLVLLVRSSAAELRWLAAGVALAGGALVALGVVVWYRRRHVGLAVAGLARLLVPVVGRVSPALAAQLSPAHVEDGLQRYYETFDVVVADRRAVLYAFALSQFGWVFFALPLYTAALALGVRLPLALALFLVPVGGMAMVVPLPGGLGGVEVAVAGLLALLAAVDLTTAGAVVILFRLCSFWFFLLLCGAAASMAAVGVRELSVPPGPPSADSRDDEHVR